MARVITPAVRRLAKESGKLEAHVNILSLDGRIKLLSSDGYDDTPRMEIVSGSVTTDDSNDIPGSGRIGLLVTDATLADVVPLVPRHPLSPVARALLQISYSAPGDPESKHTKYGRYDVAKIGMQESAQGVTLDADFYDIARRIQRAAWFTPALIPPKRIYEQVILDILEGVVTRDKFNYTPTNRKTSGWHVYDRGNDRLKAMWEYAIAASYRYDFNEFGEGEIGFHPDARENESPAWTFIDGSGTDDSRVTVERILTDETTFNGVIVTGNSPASDKPPVEATVWDTNKNSPTYYNPADPDPAASSPYGPVPYFHDSNKITTTKQARATGLTLLPKKVGLAEQITVTAPPNPGVATADVIQAEAPRIGVEGAFVIQSVQMPLRMKDGRMTLVCRERRIFQ